MLWIWIWVTPISLNKQYSAIHIITHQRLFKHLLRPDHDQFLSFFILEPKVLPLPSTSRVTRQNSPSSHENYVSGSAVALRQESRTLLVLCFPHWFDRYAKENSNWKLPDRSKHQCSQWTPSKSPVCDYASIAFHSPWCSHPNHITQALSSYTRSAKTMEDR